MNYHDWQTKYTTSFIDNYGTRIDFNPLHNENTGSMITTRKDGHSLGGEYHNRQDNVNFYLGLYEIEFLFQPTEMGFDLLTNGTVKYSFTKIEL